MASILPHLNLIIVLFVMSLTALHEVMRWNSLAQAVRVYPNLTMPSRRRRWSFSAMVIAAVGLITFALLILIEVQSPIL